MKDFNPISEFLFDYIAVVAEMTFAIAVIGSLFLGDESIRYVYFFAPFLLAIVCMLPCIPVYMKEDMTIRQVVVQRIIELIVLEISMCAGSYYLTGGKLPKAGYLLAMASTAFFQMFTYAVKGYLEKKEAEQINHKLRESRGK